MAGDVAAIKQAACRGGALLGAMLVFLLLLPQAPALAASAGLKPSEAPLVAVGQHYFGNTDHAENADESVDLWLLPPLLTGDAITIAWHSEETSLCLAQNVDDYSWAENNNICNGSGNYEVASNGSARTVIEAKVPTSTAFLEFRGCYCEHSQPYDFVVEAIQHAIGVGLTPVAALAPTSALTGTANLSNGSPVPDGLVFTLSASWVTPVNEASHHRLYIAASSGGNLSFALNLPRTAQGKDVSFTVTRAADPQYRETNSAAVEIPVVRVAAPPPKPPKHHHHRHRHHHHRRHRHRH